MGGKRGTAARVYSMPRGDFWGRAHTRVVGHTWQDTAGTRVLGHKQDMAWGGQGGYGWTGLCPGRVAPECAWHQAALPGPTWVQHCQGWAQHCPGWAQHCSVQHSTTQNLQPSPQQVPACRAAAPLAASAPCPPPA